MAFAGQVIMVGKAMGSELVDLKGKEFDLLSLLLISFQN